jgi:outer membrane protein TolC
LQSTVELANAQLQLVNAETQMATASASLARLIGYEGGAVRAQPDSALLALAPLDTAALRHDLVTMAPSVVAAEASARAAGAQVAVSRATYFPSLSASYSNSYSGTAIGEMTNAWRWSLSVNWPLFNGFAREGGLVRASAAADAARARADDARRLAQSEFTQYLASLRAAQARTTIAQVSRAAAEENLRVQRERYRLGAATIVEVLTAQVNLDQAETDLITARFDFLVARAQLEALLGREL